MDVREYGLDLTNNSKTGFAFSLPRSNTCIGATDVCKKHCYGKSIRYQSQPQKTKRERNFRTAQFLLEKGGSKLLAENLVTLIDHAKPLDWLSAKLTGGQTVLPWTLRIHDVGDYPEHRNIPSRFKRARRMECSGVLCSAYFFVVQSKLCKECEQLIVWLKSPNFSFS